MANITSADATAIIDSALLNAQNGTPDATTKPISNETSGLQPGPLPTDEPTSDDEDNLTPDQKKERADQEKIRKAQEDMLGEEQAKALAEEQRKQEERNKTLIGVADNLLKSSKSKASAVGTKVGNLPTPGNITVPLTLLVLFFFILITYAGHTRLQWIWLTLTGNAYVSGSEQTSSNTGTGGGPPIPDQEVLIGAILPTPPANGMAGGNPYS
jgi:hypothetical protein